MSVAGNTSFDLTAVPWTESGVTSSQLLVRINGELSYFASLENSNGSFTDPASGQISGSAPFAYSEAVVASTTGNTTYLNQAVQAFNYAASDYAADNLGENGGTGGPEFELPPLVKAYTLFKNGGLVSQPQLTAWANEISAFNYTPSEANGNWSTFAMDGAWLQYKAGLVSHATAVNEIENLWNTYQQYLENSSTDGLYEDTATGAPGSLSVEAEGRGNITDIIAQGYDGPSAGTMTAAVQQGGANSLLMEDPSGQAPTGGRTDDHVFVDAAYEAIDQELANMNAGSNPGLAAQYQRAADLTFQEIGNYALGDGSFSVTKNQFPASDRVGYQTASNVVPYNANLMASTADAYQGLIASTTAEAPAPNEIGGYVYTTPTFFGATFANAGGTAVEIETEGRGYDEFGQTWNALGIDRIGTTNFDNRVGPSDGVYDADTGQGVTFGPAWQQNGSWTTLADNPYSYGGSVTTQLATPALTELTVTWSGNGPTFTQRLTITPDGVLSQITELGGGQFGTTLPLLADDGQTTLNQSISGRIASTSYPGASDTESFLALNSDAQLSTGSNVLSTYGNLTPVLDTSSDSEQDTFVYPSSSGDPAASDVLSSFVLTSTGYTSDIGWVNGTLYSGRTSAGGYGNSISLATPNGTPDVTFSAPVNFILQISSGVITSVETDAAVNAIIEGRSYTLGANSPQAVSGGSPSQAVVPLSSNVPGATVTIGSGPDTLALQVSEDAYEGNAQFTVSVDGVQIGGTQTATASHSAGQTQIFDVLGTFAAGNHTATVDYLNNAYGGTPATDRNLYVTGATIDGTTVPAATLNEYSQGPQSFNFSTPGTSPASPPPPVTIGSGPDTLALQVSEDAWNGDAQFTVSVDGVQIGGTQTATALHSAGQTQTFDVLGTFAAGNHTATIDFLNDAYGGTPATDRNLYVTGATIDGATVPAATLNEYNQGPQSFSFLAPGDQGTGTINDTVSVNHPANLAAGLQTITGTESDPSQPIFLDWHEHGTPTLSSADWVPASVSSTGFFSAQVNVDHPGIKGTMFYRIGSETAIAAWSDTPS